MTRGLYYLIFALAGLATLPAFGGDYVNYICPGTTWEVEIYIPAYPPQPAQKYIETYSVKDTVINNKNCLAVMSNLDETSHNSLYIDSDKVFILSSNSNEWELLYDFALSDGEKCEVSVKGYDFLTNIIYKSNGYFSVYPNISYMKVYDQYSEETPLDDDHIITWIPGIGSIYGLFQNAGVDLIGDYGSKLLKVENDGKTLYTAEGYTNSKESVPTSLTIDAPIFNIMGQRIEKPNKGIYIRNGKKFVIK